MDLNLKGKVAIVTGAGRGIGRAIALTFANEGAFVVVNDIDLAVAKDVAQNIVSMGSHSLAIKADITRADEVDKMVTQTLDEFKKMDILVNNAGIVYEGSGPITRELFAESFPEQWHREVDLVFYGTLNCIKAVIGYMIKQKSGKIVNIASDVARNTMGLKRESTYSGAKGGVIAFTRSLALEVSEYGITVNTVSPGLIRTTRAMLAEKQKDENPKAYQYLKFVEKSLAEGIPLGRMGEPDDVAKLVVFLASDAASWITGQTYSVNGGQVMI